MILGYHEVKLGWKNLMIWSLTVGLICWGCILLYKTVAGSLSSVAEMYAKMGEVTKALGMDKVSLATLDGYFATEIALMFGLGSGMFAALLGITSLSKEEEGHTSEFLYALPLSRRAIVFWKYLAILFNLVIFNLVCILLEAVAIWQIDLEFSFDLFLTYHGLAFLMQLELMSLAFFLSSLNSRKQVGLAFGLTFVTYTIDLMCRIIPDIDFVKYVTPFYYASGADVFSRTELDGSLILVAGAVILLSLYLASMVIERRDIK